MKDLLTELTGSLQFVIALVLVAVGLVVLLVLVLLNRARDAAQYADLATAQPSAGEGEESSLQVLDLRSAPTQAEMVEAMRRALRLMRGYLPGKGARYQVPWLLSLGQTGAGKTTLLANTGLKAPYGEPEATSVACLWWLFDRAVVLDVAGDLVLRLDGRTSDQPSWRTLLKLVQRSRRRRPLDGLLLSIPVTQLLAYDPADAASLSALAHQAELLRSRLEEARATLGFELPVYTVVTQCDRLPGFADFAAGLEPGETAQMFGWSVRTSPDLPYSDSWVDDAFESIVASLDRQQLRSLRAARPLADPQAFLALPAAVGALREALRIFWNQIFAGGQLDESLPVRGLYLAGGEGFAEEGIDAHPPSPGYRSFAAAEETGRHRPVHFVSDLISQKLLFEWNLAHPLRPVRRRERLKLLALQVAVGTALLLGPLAIRYGYKQTSSDADSLRCAFLIPARCALSKPPDPTSAGERRLHKAATGLLASVRKVPSYDLRSAYLPASWWNRFAERVRSTALDAYGRIVFPALAQDLAISLYEVAARPDEIRQQERVDDSAALPELDELRSLLTELNDLDARVGIYDDIAGERCQPDDEALLKSFQTLVRGFDPTLEITPPESAESFYTDVLCDATADRFPVDAKLNEDLQNKVRRLSDDATHRLFYDNVLVRDLDDLQTQVDKLARSAPPQSRMYDDYDRLVKVIDKTRRDLLRPEVVRIVQTSLHLSQTLREVTQAIAANRFLGQDFAREIGGRSKDAYEAFLKSLADYSTEATGALLAQQDGKVQLQLSPSILGLEAALKALLQRYAQPRQATQLTLAPPAGTFLAWNAQTLQQAVDLYTNYQAFMGKSFNGYPGFQQVVNQASKGAVEPNVLDLVKQGQSFPALPRLGSRELREGHLQAQVDNLTQAATPLNALLGALSKPPPVNGCAGAPSSAYCQLGLALLAQQRTLLGQLDTLLADQALYATVAGAFDGWSGDAGDVLAWRAFGVEDAAGLTAYLTNQRRIVQTLASRYATPILTVVPLGTDLGGGTSTALRRWKVILADLEDYKNKVPDNALLTLETFITGTLSTATTASCLAVAMPANSCFAPGTPADLTANAPPCDYFLLIRNRLLQRLQERCTPLNYQDGEAAYARIQDTFTSRLAGKFPFTTGKTSAGGDAKPADLEAFFAVFDADRVAVRQLLAAAAGVGSQAASPTPPWPAATRAEVAAFLDELQEVRSFFSTFLDRKTAAKATAPAGTAAPAAPRPPDVPAFGLQASFRPLPGLEQGGNEIIARSLQAGSVSLPSVSAAAATPAPPPLWLYGTPVQITLRWAKDSLAVPTQVSQAIEEGQLKVGERTATFLAQGPWSLLQLLRYGAAPDQAAGTLRLEVPVVAAPAIPGSGQRGAAKVPAPSTPARVYLKIDLTRPDAGQEPLTVPAFPASAPDVP